MPKHVSVVYTAPLNNSTLARERCFSSRHERGTKKKIPLHWATESPRWARSIMKFIWHASCILPFWKAKRPKVNLRVSLLSFNQLGLFAVWILLDNFQIVAEFTSFLVIVVSHVHLIWLSWRTWNRQLLNPIKTALQLKANNCCLLLISFD